MDVRCKHVGKRRFGGVRWCPNCGACKAAGQWQYPQILRDVEAHLARQATAEEAAATDSQATGWTA